MTERPILFSGEMVRAILDGRKTQTRRVVTPSRYMQHYAKKRYGGFDSLDQGNQAAASAAMSHLAMGSGHFPYGQPGDRLWVRENFGLDQSVHMSRGGTIYRADVGQPGVLHTDTHDGYQRELKGSRRWRPSIHMPRWASRLTLEVTDVRVERLQNISELDCEKELGVEPYSLHNDAYQRYTDLWNRLNAQRGYPFSSNPWVWVIDFRRADEQRAAA